MCTVLCINGRCIPFFVNLLTDTYIDSHLELPIKNCLKCVQLFHSNCASLDSGRSVFPCDDTILYMGERLVCGN